MLLAKMAAAGVVIWFYLTAKDHDEPSVKWAIIGLIGFAITWELAHLAADTLLPKSPSAAFISSNLPAFVGVAAAWLIRKKLLLDTKRDNS
ncbi:MAG: hypothetical protein WCJ11_03390 [Methylococcaceae bacterium]